MEYAENGIVMDVTPHSVTESFSDTQCRNVFKQLVEAVNHLHTNGIVHRGKKKKWNAIKSSDTKRFTLLDIKPQNLLLSSDNLVKLIDFGNATTVSDTLSYNSTGTPAFMAPELLKKGMPPLTSFLFLFLLTTRNLISSAKPSSDFPYLCRSVVDGRYTLLFHIW